MNKIFFDTTLYDEIKNYINLKVTNKKFKYHLRLVDVNGEDIFRIYIEYGTNINIIFSNDIVLLDHKEELDKMIEVINQSTDHVMLY